MTTFRASGPIHRDYRQWLPPSSSTIVITPFPGMGDEGAAGDQDDATYIQMAYPRDIVVGGGDLHFLSLGTPATPMSEVAASITGVTMFVRASYLTDRSVPNRAGSALSFGLSHDILLEPSGIEGFWDLYSDSVAHPAMPLIADGVVREFSHTWAFEDFAIAGNDPYTDWQPFITGVEAGQVFANFTFKYAQVSNETARTDTVRIHEAWVVVNGGGRDTYRRNYPRDDGLAGGARRTYPPSKATQTGNRTTGGYL